MRHAGYFCIEQLDPTFTRGSGVVAQAPMVLGPKRDPIPGDEAPILFRVADTYYLLEGTGCCGCKGGASILALSAKHPLGPYTLQGNIGEAADGTPVTKAQQRAVFWLPTPAGGRTYIHVGNNYVPGGGGKGTCTNEGLLYWWPLQFTANGTVRPIEWRDEVSFEMA